MDNLINIPASQPNLNEEPWKGSFQQLLNENIGKLVKVEYALGTSGLISQMGRVYSVSTRYLLLWDETRRLFTTGDMFSLKTITFYPEDNK